MLLASEYTPLGLAGTLNRIGFHHFECLFLLLQSFHTPHRHTYAHARILTLLRKGRVRLAAWASQGFISLVPLIMIPQSIGKEVASATARLNVIRVGNSN